MALAAHCLQGAIIGDNVLKTRSPVDHVVKLSTGYPNIVGNMPKLNVNFAWLGAALLWAGVMLVTCSVLAAPTVRRNLGLVKAGADQARLEVRRDEAQLEAAVCAPTCDWSKAARVTLEPPFSNAAAALSVLELGYNRRAGLVTVAVDERKYQWLVAAPVTAPPSTPTSKSTSSGETLVFYSGETGLVRGEAPDRTGQIVEVLPGEQGSVSVVLGVLQEDVSLCGRQALLSPQLLHPETLTWRGIKFQRVPRAERDTATSLGLVPRTSQLSNRVLNPLIASSGQRGPLVLADDDLGTVWTEGRGGTGGGEFVVLRAPLALGLTGLTFSLPEHADPSYSAPESFWVLTDNAVCRASIASDPTHEGVREWYLPFPSPVHTSCVALALDGAKDLGPATAVGWAEVGATTDVGEAVLARALADLDTGGDQATAAEQLLQGVGRDAFARVQKRYEHYSESGRMRALNVLDAAPCNLAVGTYAAALSNEGTAEAEHGERGLHRCKREAIAVLSHKLAKAGSERARVIAGTLVRLDPVAALDAMVPLLDGGSRARRHVLKLAVAQATRVPAALERAKALLLEPTLQQRRGLFLLRGLGDSVVHLKDVAIPRLRGWLDAASFDVRYLALAPAAKLAAFDGELDLFLRNAACCSKEAALRAEAARWLLPTALGTKTLIGALADPHVRVREAAVVNVGEHAVTAARQALVRRLQDDAWPFVRSAAARAIGQLPPEPSSTRVLAEVATDDASANVRRPALFVLGALHATSELEYVRDGFTDDKDADVRAAAAATLGLLCDHSMTEPLTEAALKLASLTSSEGDRVIAQASLHALGRLAPNDLKARLAPLFTKGVLQTSKMAAEAALAQPETCRKQSALVAQ
jgi:HEAT repeat protein